MLSFGCGCTFGSFSFIFTYFFFPTCCLLESNVTYVKASYATAHLNYRKIKNLNNVNGFKNDVNVTVGDVVFFS